MTRMNGIEKYQEEQRANMLARIDEAICCMRADKLSINKSTLAKRLGVSRSTLYSDYIIAHLQTYPEFNSSLNEPSNLGVKTQQLLNERAALEAKIKANRVKERELKEKCKALQAQIKKVKTDYELLLGRYQTDMEKKLNKF